MVCTTIVFLMATVVYRSRKTYLFKNSILSGYKLWCAGMGVELECGEGNGYGFGEEGVRAWFIRAADGDMKFVKVD
jgi:hypothetical protein